MIEVHSPYNNRVSFAVPSSRPENRGDGTTFSERTRLHVKNSPSPPRLYSFSNGFGPVLETVP